MQISDNSRTFLNVPQELDRSKITTPYAFLGIPYGPPYRVADVAVCAEAPMAVRNVTYDRAYAFNWNHYDWDTRKSIFENDQPIVTDAGDIATNVYDPAAIWDEGTAEVRKLVHNGVIPLVVGGLDSIPPIVVNAFDGQGEFNVLHVDAHLDFREEVNGIHRGYSSPIRRIRDNDFIKDIVQVGLRSMGSARQEEVDAAYASGNRIVNIWDFDEQGAKAFAESLPRDRKWLVTIDCDGLDPAVAPGVGWPEPGGIDYREMATILRSLAQSDSIAALIFTEFQPRYDVRGATATTIARLMMNVMGLQPLGR